MHRIWKRRQRRIYDKIGTDTAVLVKGGHERNTANDCLYTKEGTFWFEGKRVENDNTHGTGCTLSSAIACNLAMGHTMQESVEMQNVTLQVHCRRA